MTDPFKQHVVNRAMAEITGDLDGVVDLHTPYWTEGMSEAKAAFAQRLEWAETGQRKSRNVPPRPKHKRKPKGAKTHRK